MILLPSSACSRSWGEQVIIVQRKDERLTLLCVSSALRRAAEESVANTGL